MEIPFSLMPEGIFCVRMEMNWKYTEKIAMIFNKLRLLFSIYQFFAFMGNGWYNYREDRGASKQGGDVSDQSEPRTSLRAAGWTLEAAKAGKPRWNKERYATKPVQLSLFPSKQPPAEYKQRWAKALNQKEDTTT